MASLSITKASVTAFEPISLAVQEVRPTSASRCVESRRRFKEAKFECTTFELARLQAQKFSVRTKGMNAQ